MDLYAGLSSVLRADDGCPIVVPRLPAKFGKRKKREDPSVSNEVNLHKYFWIGAFLSELLSNAEAAQAQSTHALFGLRSLHRAIRSGSLEMVRHLLSARMDPNDCEGKVTSPLILASQLDEIAIAKLLLENHASVQVEFTGLESTPLFCAAWNGSKEMVKLLLEYRSDPKRGEPCAIHSAAMSGDIEILKMLVKHPEDVVVKDQVDCVPLHFACRFGHFECVEHLVSMTRSGNASALDVPDLEGNTPVFYAIEAGATEIAAYLLKNGTNVEHVNKKGKTLLHVACEQNMPPLVEWLLDHGLLPEMTDVDGNTPMILAAATGNLQLVEQFESISADQWTTQNHSGSTAAHEAAKRNHANILAFLVKKGVDIDRVNSNGCTPLMLACAHGHHQSVQILSHFTKEIDKKDTRGRSAAHFAVHCSRDDESCARMLTRLIEKGIDIDACESNGQTPLHIVVSRTFYNAARILSSTSTHIGTRDADGFTPLHIAVSKGNREMLHVLLDSPSGNPHVLTNSDESLLYMAIKYGCNEIAQYLVEKGVSPMSKTKSGDTPLHLCVSKQNHLLLDAFLEYGVDLTKEDGKKDRPYDIAKRLHDKVAMKKLGEVVKCKNIPCGAKNVVMTSELSATCSKCFTPLEFPCPRPAEIFCAQTELCKVASEKNLETAQRILGGNINVNFVTAGHESPLHCAIMGGSMEIIHLLLKKGADVNMRDEKGETPLFGAIRGNNVDIVKELLSIGAQVNVVNEQSTSPIHITAGVASERLLRVVCDAGANVFATDDASRTIFHYLLAFNQPDLIELVLGYASNEKAMAKRLFDLHAPMIVEWRDAALREVEDNQRTEGLGLMQKYKDPVYLFSESDLRLHEEDHPSVQCGELTQSFGSFLSHDVHIFRLPLEALSGREWSLMLQEAPGWLELRNSHMIAFIGFCKSSGFLNIISQPSNAKHLEIQDSKRTLGECLRLAIDVGTLFSFLCRDSLDLIPAFINPCTVFVDSEKGCFLSVAHLMMDKIHHIRGRSSCSHFHPFFSPEMYNCGHEWSAESVSQSIVYSFGLLMWSLVHHEFPWKNDIEEHGFEWLRRRILFDQHRPLIDAEMRVPYVFQTLIVRCLHSDATKRPTLEFVVEELRRMTWDG
eukprot:TRINITY_DN2808_c0_g1_i5.p1 TRINITY_DN2808_c0_g1~~TRINITY_DN2808_c0_g1_i5.p1  ORF type:complete len:1126 (+),score=248.76 TRINITY_DN2808_c0_g1_i5:182-3559(+)